MKRFKVIELNNNAVIEIKADGFHLGSVLTFYINVPFFNTTTEKTVAQFNWDNIAGFMEVDNGLK